MPRDSGCARPAEHHQHLCELKKSLPKRELDPLMQHPKFVCAHCGGRTRSGGNLCQPQKIRR